MIEHVTLSAADINRSKAFYKKVLKTVGYEQNYDFKDAAGFIEGGHTSFWVVERSIVQATHVAFLAHNKDAVQAFYDSALAEGAKDNGAPGYRKEYSPDYYAAFVLDPDGHNIEAVCYIGE